MNWWYIAIGLIGVALLIVMMLIYERLGSIDKALGSLRSAKWRTKQGLD